MHDKAFNIAKEPKYDGYQSSLASMVYNCFDKETSGGAVKNKSNSNQELAGELHTPIIRKFETQKVYSTSVDNIWPANLADMQLISKFNKIIRFLLCITDLFSKYAWFIPLKDKKGITITNAFQKVLNQSNCKSEQYG